MIMKFLNDKNKKSIIIIYNKKLLYSNQCQKMKNIYLIIFSQFIYPENYSKTHALFQLIDQ